jgi:DNA replication protein DnaC
MTQQKTSDQTLHQQILQHLETLNVPLKAEQVDEILVAATKAKLSYLQLLERFLSVPAHLRLERSIERRLRSARFRDPATFESFDWEFNRKTIDQVSFEELATGDFIRRQDNLVFVGESGLGKSHLIQSVGRRCCVSGYRVRYVTSAELLEELTAASGDKTLPERVRYYCRFDLLIIDEFGFEKLERREYPESSSLLYKIIDSRSRRGSTALVTNIEFEDWTDYLGDPPLAMALIDRMVDDAIIERFKGKSYRAFRAEQKAKQNGNGSQRSTKASKPRSKAS